MCLIAIGCVGVVHDLLVFAAAAAGVVYDEDARPVLARPLWLHRSCVVGHGADGTGEMGSIKQPRAGMRMVAGWAMRAQRHARPSRGREAGAR